ncbi:hypothetical protein BC937DRAFT_87490 [Endogone sp. FLAS-F59071]|nr:hypothetical protein BC937DRAFT_87490 [Endogone sp. FLAS-F59071]|eukprot:RUS19435.1 hypothetical protein BC937DRAFT_87490 [Endogone sp. FLAS-F59071]
MNDLCISIRKTLSGLVLTLLKHYYAFVFHASTDTWLYSSKKVIHQALKDSGLEYTLIFPAISALQPSQTIYPIYTNFRPSPGLWPSVLKTNINYKEHKIVITGDANMKVNFTTQSDAGRWAVAALKKPELTRNREVVVAGDLKS